MNRQIFDNESTWPNFIKKYNLHPLYGYLMPYDYQVTSFKIQHLRVIINSMPHLETLSEIEELQGIEIEETKSNFNDMMIIHDLMAALLNIYLLKGKQQEKNEIILPKKIAFPLYKASQFLKMKTGMCSSLSFNWVPINDVFRNDPDSFGFEDFELRYYLTNDKKNEKLFFGGSIIATFHLIKVIKQLYEINLIIERDTLNQKAICDKMDIIARIWDKITLENSEIVNSFDPFYFTHDLRPLVGGFDNLYFEGVDKNISSTGGTAGSDPSFMIFEHAMGITLEKSNESGYKEMREAIMKAISEDHRKLIQYMNGSKIRQYCHCSRKLIAKYNMVLNKYRSFLRLHSVFIEKFILSQMPKHLRTDAKGVAGSTISAMINKHKDIESYTIPQEGFVKQEIVFKEKLSSKKRNDQLFFMPF